ncbi:MAG: Holliday junction resolvase RuvX [Bacteroidota bacterium]
MARILALDFGSVRTGLAVTDELQLIASGLTTIATVNLIDFLNGYLEKENVACIVIGEPKQMNGAPSESEVQIGNFIQKLKTLFPGIPIQRQDERFTSKIATKSMLEGGLKKKQRQNKALVDEISATIILQAYLERKQL